MPTPTFQPPQGEQSTAELQDWIVKLIRDLNFMLGNLDTLNVNRLDAKVIIAQTITANKMNVAQLSAIAADLGHITAGLIEAVQIYGSYIATSTSYPRVEISSTSNLFVASQIAGNDIKIIPTTGPGTPAILFDVGGATQASIQQNPNTNNFGITTSSPTSLSLQSATSLNLSSSGSLTIDGITAYNGSFSFVTSVDFVGGTYASRTVNVRKGIITSVV